MSCIIVTVFFQLILINNMIRFWIKSKFFKFAFKTHIAFFIYGEQLNFWFNCMKVFKYALKNMCFIKTISRQYFDFVAFVNWEEQIFF